MTGPRPLNFRLAPSSLHATFDAVAAHERATGQNVIRLHVGEPAFEPPLAVREAVASAVLNKSIQYTGSKGLPTLRRSLAEKLRRANNIEALPDQLFVCPGSTQGLYAAMTALWRPGAVALLPEIHWPIHLQQSLLAGFRAAFYPLDTKFRPASDAFDNAPRETAFVLVNQPSNPTGAIWDRTTLSLVLETARQRGWAVLSDEAYEDFWYDTPPLQIAGLESGLHPDDRCTHSVFSFSKSYAMTGYRLGYVVAPNRHAAAVLERVQEASLVSPPVPAQYGGIVALECDEFVEDHRKRIAKLRDRCLPQLVRRGWLSGLPAGGWYAFLDLSRSMLDGKDSSTKLLRDWGVAVAPAAEFTAYGKNHLTGMAQEGSGPWIRIAFCGDPASVEEGIRRIVACLESESDSTRQAGGGGDCLRALAPVHNTSPAGPN